MSDQWCKDLEKKKQTQSSQKETIKIKAEIDEMKERKRSIVPLDEDIKTAVPHG